MDWLDPSTRGSQQLFPTIARQPLSGRAAISPSMALRMERCIGRDHGGAAEVWLAQKAAYFLGTW
jgi:plasmid maintenance system antidote protein VapI